MLIEFGKLELKHLILLLFPIFEQGQNFISEDFNEKDNLFFTPFIYYLSCAFSGIIYIIVKKLTITKNQKEEKKNKKQKIIELKNLKKQVDKNNINSYQILEIESYKKEKEKRKDKFFFLLLIVCLHMIGILITSIFQSYIKKPLLKNLPALLTFIYLIIFSIIFLNFSLYIHQYFSVAILTICLIIFTMESIFYHDIKFLDIFKGIIYVFFYEAFFCLSDVLGKKYLNKYIDDIHLFLFKFGIIALVPFLIYDIIAYVSNADEKYHCIIRILKNFDSFYFDIILKFIFNIFYCLGLWLTIYYFSPCHFIILITLKDFFDIICKSYIFKSKQKEEDKYNNYEMITFYILYPILIFFVLVFNEIIILNFCKLSYNTKLNIMQREKKETNDVFNEDPLEEKIFEDNNNGILFDN